MFVPPLSAPAGPQPTMVRRVLIAQAALDHFHGKPFAWGKADCVRLGAFVMRQAGHKPPSLAAVPYGSERTARRALAKLGFATLVDAVDSVGLPRISPLGALPGDLIAFPAEDADWQGLTVCLGNGRVLGFTEAAQLGACSVIAARLALALAAWSVTPWRK